VIADNDVVMRDVGTRGALAALLRRALRASNLLLPLP
jgi:hypothetical protein